MDRFKSLTLPIEWVVNFLIKDLKIMMQDGVWTFKADYIGQYTRCTIKGCYKPYFGRGLCNMHHTRVREHGSPFILKTRVAAKCAVEDCPKKSKCRSYCHTHYGQWRRHGDPTRIPDRDKRHDGVCIVDGCNLKFYSKKRCRIHYERYYNKQKKLNAV